MGIRSRPGMAAVFPKRSRSKQLSVYGARKRLLDTGYRKLFLGRQMIWQYQISDSQCQIFDNQLISIIPFPLFNCALQTGHSWYCWRIQFQYFLVGHAAGLSSVSSVIMPPWTSWQHVLLNSPTVSGMSRLSVDSICPNAIGGTSSNTSYGLR